MVPDTAIPAAFVCRALPALLVVGFACEGAAEPRSGNAHASAGDLGADTNSDQTPERETPTNSSANEHASIRVVTRASAPRHVQQMRFPSGMVTRVNVDGATGSRDLGELLQQVAGVTVRRSSSFGQSSFASVRGGNPRQIAVSLNHMRLSAPAGLGFDLGRLAVAGIDSVDVYKGAAATTFGGGALTGALNLRALPPSRHGWAMTAQSAAGSFGTRQITGRGAYVTDHAAVQLDATWRASDGDFDYLDAQRTAHRRRNNAHEHLSLLGTGRFELGDHKLESTLLLDGGEAGVAGPAEFEDAFAHAQIDTRRAAGQLRWSAKTLYAGSRGVVDAHASIGYQHRESIHTDTQSFPSGLPVDDQTRHTSLSLSAGLDTWFTLGSMLRGRLDARIERYDKDHRTPQLHRALSARRLTLAAAANNEWLAVDDRLSLVTSLRLAWTDERPAASASASTPERRAWLLPTPAAGVSWRTRRAGVLKANIARTHRVPDLDELYLDLVGMRGDPGLEPERATNLDLGWEWGGERSTTTGHLAGFYNDIDEMIRFVASNAYLVEARNLGAGSSYGLEASGRWRAHERLELGANYTWTESALRTLAQTNIPGQPRHRASAEATVGLHAIRWLGDLPRLDLSARADWRSATNLDPFGNLVADPYWTLDFGARVHPAAWLEFAVDVRNATDNRWGSDTLQRPLPGRAFFVSATTHLNKDR